jgi:hypothetical protein
MVSDQPLERMLEAGRLALIPTRFISATVDEVYQAMRNNPGLPSKDKFMQKLNTKLQAKLSVQFSQTKKRGSEGLR